MRFTINRKPNTQPTFGNLKVGDLFLDVLSSECIAMKCQDMGNNYNAIIIKPSNSSHAIEAGYRTKWDDHAKIIPISHLEVTTNG